MSQAIIEAQTSAALSPVCADELTCDTCYETLIVGQGITTDDDKTFCSEDCASEAGYAQCVHCGRWHEERYTNGDRENVCDICWDNEGYCLCEDCGEVCDNDSSYYVEQDCKVICESCFNSDYETCADCGEIHTHSATNYVEHQNSHVCDRCYGRNYFHCDSCQNNWHNDYYGSDGMCQDCYDNSSDSRIHDYSYTPDYRFRKSPKDTDNSNLYFGIELEIEVSNSIDDACDIVDKNSNLYMKHDGSIDHGFEIVSHPCTLNFWLDSIEDFKAMLRGLSRQDCDAESQGLHVHISKGGMTDAHKIRFQAFFDAQKKILPIIARRPHCAYAKHKDLAHGNWKKSIQDDDRYQAVNWLPERTVEVRIFRGTLDCNEFLASLLFCHAVYQFTKHDISLATIANDKSWKLFCKFIKGDKCYKTLINYLIKNEIMES